eukprot:TRINITY_DN1301_c0_g1_i1.p1 TRINITY_DN1301_c0_g1~~TRINITY_DN1301_c0_g1_i1.p1  ORF type:complete len:2640 (+),score=766.27 TRINITY_DN1301_c0_g1_i1:767-7921(+)
MHDTVHVEGVDMVAPPIVNPAHDAPPPLSLDCANGVGMLAGPISVDYRTRCNQTYPGSQAFVGTSECALSSTVLRTPYADFAEFWEAFYDVYYSIYPPEAALAVEWKDNLSLYFDTPLQYCVTNARGGTPCLRFALAGVPTDRGTEAQTESAAASSPRTAGPGWSAPASAASSPTGRQACREHMVPLGASMESLDDEDLVDAAHSPANRTRGGVLPPALPTTSGAKALSEDRVRMVFFTHDDPREGRKYSGVADFVASMEAWDAAAKGWVPVLQPCRGRLEITETPTGLPKICGKGARRERYNIQLVDDGDLQLSDAAWDALSSIFGDGAEDDHAASPGGRAQTYWDASGVGLTLAPREGDGRRHPVDVTQGRVDADWTVSADPPPEGTDVVALLQHHPTQAFSNLGVIKVVCAACPAAEGLYAILPCVTYNRRPVWASRLGHVNGARRLFYEDGWRILVEGGRVPKGKQILLRAASGTEGADGDEGVASPTETAPTMPPQAAPVDVSSWVVSQEPTKGSSGLREAPASPKHAAVQMGMPGPSPTARAPVMVASAAAADVDALKPAAVRSSHVVAAVLAQYTPAAAAMELKMQAFAAASRQDVAALRKALHRRLRRVARAAGPPQRKDRRPSVQRTSKPLSSTPRKAPAGDDLAARHPEEVDFLLYELCLELGLAPADWLGPEPPGVASYVLHALYRHASPGDAGKVDALVASIHGGARSLKAVVELICDKYGVEAAAWTGDFPEALRQPRDGDADAAAAQCSPDGYDASDYDPFSPTRLHMELRSTAEAAAGSYSFECSPLCLSQQEWRDVADFGMVDEELFTAGQEGGGGSGSERASAFAHRSPRTPTPSPAHRTAPPPLWDPELRIPSGMVPLVALPPQDCSTVGLAGPVLVRNYLEGPVLLLLDGLHQARFPGGAEEATPLPLGAVGALLCRKRPLRAKFGAGLGAQKRDPFGMSLSKRQHQARADQAEQAGQWGDALPLPRYGVEEEVRARDHDAAAVFSLLPTTAETATLAVLPPVVVRNDLPFAASVGLSLTGVRGQDEAKALARGEACAVHDVRPQEDFYIDVAATCPVTGAELWSQTYLVPHGQGDFAKRIPLAEVQVPGKPKDAPACFNVDVRVITLPSACRATNGSALTHPLDRVLAGDGWEWLREAGDAPAGTPGRPLGKAGGLVRVVVLSAPLWVVNSTASPIDVTSVEGRPWRLPRDVPVAYAFPAAMLLCDADVPLDLDAVLGDAAAPLPRLPGLLGADGAAAQSCLLHTPEGDVIKASLAYRRRGGSGAQQAVLTLSPLCVVHNAMPGTTVHMSYLAQPPAEVKSGGVWLSKQPYDAAAEISVSIVTEGDEPTGSQKAVAVFTPPPAGGEIIVCVGPTWVPVATHRDATTHAHRITIGGALPPAPVVVDNKSWLPVVVGPRPPFQVTVRPFAMSVYYFPPTKEQGRRVESLSQDAAAPFATSASQQRGHGDAAAAAEDADAPERVEYGDEVVLRFPALPEAAAARVAMYLDGTGADAFLEHPDDAAPCATPMTRSAGAAEDVGPACALPISVSLRHQGPRVPMSKRRRKATKPVKAHLRSPTIVELADPDMARRAQGAPTPPPAWALGLGFKSLYFVSEYGPVGHIATFSGNAPGTVIECNAEGGVQYANFSMGDVEFDSMLARKAVCEMLARLAPFPPEDVVAQIFPLAYKRSDGVLKSTAKQVRDARARVANAGLEDAADAWAAGEASTTPEEALVALHQQASAGFTSGVGQPTEAPLILCEVRDLPPCEFAAYLTPRGLRVLASALASSPSVPDNAKPVAQWIAQHFDNMDVRRLEAARLQEEDGMLCDATAAAVPGAGDLSSPLTPTEVLAYLEAESWEDALVALGKDAPAEVEVGAGLTLGQVRDAAQRADLAAAGKNPLDAAAAAVDNETVVRAATGMMKFAASKKIGKNVADIDVTDAGALGQLLLANALKTGVGGASGAVLASAANYLDLFGVGMEMVQHPGADAAAVQAMDKLSKARTREDIVTTGEDALPTLRACADKQPDGTNAKKELTAQIDKFEDALQAAKTHTFSEQDLLTAAHSFLRTGRRDDAAPASTETAPTTHVTDVNADDQWDTAPTRQAFGGMCSNARERACDAVKAALDSEGVAQTDTAQFTDMFSSAKERASGAVAGAKERYAAAKEPAETKEPDATQEAPAPEETEAKETPASAGFADMFSSAKERASGAVAGAKERYAAAKEPAETKEEVPAPEETEKFADAPASGFADFFATAKAALADAKERVAAAKEFEAVQPAREAYEEPASSGFADMFASAAEAFGHRSACSDLEGDSIRLAPEDAPPTRALLSGASKTPSPVNEPLTGGDDALAALLGDAPVSTAANVSASTHDPVAGPAADRHEATA